MVQIEGTFATVRSPVMNDFFEKLGQTKEMSAKTVGTHWTMHEWQVAPNKWGFVYACKEIPNFVSLDFFEENVQNETLSPITGKMTKAFVKRTDDGFFTTFTSDNAEPYTLKEVYSDDRITCTWSFKDTSVTEIWIRTHIWCGAYSVVKTINVEDFFGSFGQYFVDQVKKYKASFRQKGDTYQIIEWFGGLGKIANDLKLNHEVPWYLPGENTCVPTTRTCKLEKKCIHSFLMTIKNPDGSVEEWTVKFGPSKVTLSGVDLNTKKACSMELNANVDIEGTYKMVANHGFEEFGKKMGMPADLIKGMTQDKYQKLEIYDLGDGVHFQKTFGAAYAMSLKYKLGQEFEVFHPIMKELVTGVITLDCNKLNATMKTSKGEIKSVCTFKGNFVSMCTQLVGKDSWYAVCMERI